MEFKSGKNTYKIEYGYKAVAQGKLLSRFAHIQLKIQSIEKEDETSREIDAFETLLGFIPEMLLVGLQKKHYNKFGYDMVTNEGKAEQLEKVYELLEGYINDGGEIMELFSEISKELTEEGFLAHMFQKELAKAKELEQKNQAE